MSEKKIKVESGIPIPPGKNTKKYPWNEMKVGDSFLFPSSTNTPHEAARTASQRMNPKKFRTRKTEEGIRCWRVN